MEVKIVNRKEYAEAIFRLIKVWVLYSYALDFSVLILFIRTFVIGMVYVSDQSANASPLVISGAFILFLHYTEFADPSDNAYLDDSGFILNFFYHRSIDRPTLRRVIVSDIALWVLQIYFLKSRLYRYTDFKSVQIQGN